MAKERMYSFAEEKHSGKGIAATVFGGLSCVIFFALAGLAYYLNGQGGIYLGSIGFAGAVFAVCGVVLGLMSFSESHVRHLFSRIGFVLSGFMLALWVFVVLIGL